MSIELTEDAANHVKNHMEKDDTSDYLRLAVKPTGCSGFMYEVTMATETQSHDSMFISKGINVVVDSESLKYLDGSKVDFARDGLNKGFRFNNPNVGATCGCGESFTLEEH